MEEEELRQKKEELQKQYMKQKEEEQGKIETEAKIQALLKRLMEEDARSRLNNVKLVNMELYSKAVQAVLGLAQKGYLKGKLSDGQAKEILRQLKGNREISIRRK